MATSLLAPPEPRRHDDLEALIEEARPRVQWAALTRNGVLVLVSPSGPFAPSLALTRARVLRLVDALRPVPR